MSDKRHDNLSESTIARIAGNLLSGMNFTNADMEIAAKVAVAQARAIAAEVRRTRPDTEPAQ